MILVIGATGFVGRYLIEYLLSKYDMPLRCLVRNKRDYERLSKLGVNVVYGDITQNDFESCLKNVEIVINLVTIIRETKYNTFENVFSGLKKLVWGCDEKKVKRFLHISALGIDDYDLQAHPYMYFKHLIEEEIKKTSLNYTILRTSIIYGEGDQVPSFLAFLAKNLKFIHPIPCQGETQYQPLSVHDLVKCISLWLRKDIGLRQVLDVAGSEHYSHVELVDIILQKLQLTRVKVFLPKFCFWPVVKVMEFVMTYPPVTSQMITLSTCRSCVADKDVILKTFGFQPKVFSLDNKYLENVDVGFLKKWIKGTMNKDELVLEASNVLYEK